MRTCTSLIRVLGLGHENSTRLPSHTKKSRFTESFHGKGTVERDFTAVNLSAPTTNRSNPLRERTHGNPSGSPTLPRAVGAAGSRVSPMDFARVLRELRRSGRQDRGARPHLQRPSHQRLPGYGRAASHVQHAPRQPWPAGRGEHLRSCHRRPRGLRPRRNPDTVRPPYDEQRYTI
jgi:hypothetical protein